MAVEIPPDRNVVALPVDREGLSVHPSGLPREGRLWLLATFLLLITGLLKGINLLILLSYLLLAIWIVNWQMARIDYRRVSGRRMPSGPIFAGAAVDFEVEITVQTGGVMRGLAVDCLSDQDQRVWMVLRMQQGQNVRIRWQRVFAQRGRHQLGALRSIARFPFGLYSRSQELAPATECIVLPRIGALNGEMLRHWLNRAGKGDGRQRRRKLQRALLGAEIHGLRDYRPGDSLRWIHWRSSARRGQLLVCEFEENPSTDLILIVEPWLPARPSDAERARLEALMSMAATICREWCRDLTNRLTLIVVTPTVACLQSSTGPEFALRALEALAVSEGHPGKPSGKWLDQLPHFSQAAPVLALSSRPNSPIAAETAGYIGRGVASAHPGENPPWYTAPGEVNMNADARPAHGRAEAGPLPTVANPK